MFPLFVRSVGRFFNVAPARAAIEKFVQPRVNTSLATLGQAEWVKTVSTFFKENSASIVTMLASLGAAVEVTEYLQDNAKSPEDKAELEMIRKIATPVDFGSSHNTLPAKAGKCQTDPQAYAFEATEHRDKFAEFAALMGLPTEGAKRWVDLAQSIFLEWDVYRAMVSIK